MRNFKSVAVLDLSGWTTIGLDANTWVVHLLSCVVFSLSISFSNAFKYFRQEDFFVPFTFLFEYD